MRLGWACLVMCVIDGPGQQEKRHGMRLIVVVGAIDRRHITAPYCGGVVIANGQETDDLCAYLASKAGQSQRIVTDGLSI